MSALTTFFNLIKPAKTDGVKVKDFNDNMNIIDTEMHKPPLTVNGITPNSTTRDLTLTEVPLANNLSSNVSQVVVGSFVERTSGGDASIESGQGYLNAVKGNMVLTGYVAEVIDPVVVGDFSVTVNRDTFVAQMADSGTVEFAYTTSWSPSLVTYGLSVIGTPTNGDTITVTYVKQNLGTYVVATPTSFNSTGWNLYNNASGVKYARVVKYSNEYGYKIGGTYSYVEFAETISGYRTSLTIESGFFNVPSNGYVFVTGGDNTTYIYPTWSDWTSGYSGGFQTYTVDTIDLTEVMTIFPNGMFAVNGVRDEINLNTKSAIQRIERVSNTTSNLEDVISSGADYVMDTSYIYYVLSEPVVTDDLDIDGEYNVSDHGIEYFLGSDAPVDTEVLYGENLKDKLRTDVVTISEQELSSTQKASVRANISAAEASVVDTLNTTSTGTITAATGAGITMNSSLCIKIGRMVVVSTKFTINSSQTTGTTLATVPSGFRPSSQKGAAYCIFKRNSNDPEPASNLGNYYITSGGLIKQGMSSSWTSGWFSALWIYYI